MTKEDGHLFAFEKLMVWEKVRVLVKSIYLITKIFPKEEQFCLTNQIRRAGISIISNISEGSSRISPKNQAHFYQLSYSSLMEVLSQLIVSKDLEYIDKIEYEDLRNQIESISYLLNQLRMSTFSEQPKLNFQPSKPISQPSKL